ncbi:hypothetical protein VdG1_01935 [Verticillium dahliae VDG1]|nr:hypothetical protein VdG1_01935 [Verticillium dahliae VDG1]
MGRLVAGAVAQGEVQMAVRVEGSLGNCPKYLNGRALVARTPEVEGVEDGFPLSARARRVVDQADLFFLSSGHGTGMDTNHRGGSKGFVRIGRNDEGAVELIYPEYSGNRLYQTLGNLQANPLVGITIPDFDTSDATGTATILTGDAADALLPHTRLAVKITLTSALLVKGGLPMRATSPQDVGAVRDAVERIPGLAARLRVHVTGKIGEADEETLAKIEALGVGVERRRMEKQDLERVFEGEKRKFYLCAAPALLTIMKGWLENEEVVWEDFGY